LRSAIIKYHAVEHPEDCTFDDFGNIVWVAMDKEDGVPLDKKKVVCLIFRYYIL